MPGVARESIDYINGTTGIIQVTGVPSFFVEGYGIAKVGDSVAPHGGHIGVTMTTGSSTFSVGGQKVCRLGDQGSCLHTVSIASSTFFIGS